MTTLPLRKVKTTAGLFIEALIFDALPVYGLLLSGNAFQLIEKTGSVRSAAAMPRG
jgi:hypothetical protein